MRRKPLVKANQDILPRGCIDEVLYRGNPEPLAPEKGQNDGGGNKLPD